MRFRPSLIYIYLVFILFVSSQAQAYIPQSYAQIIEEQRNLAYSYKTRNEVPSADTINNLIEKCQDVYQNASEILFSGFHSLNETALHDNVVSSDADSSLKYLLDVSTYAGTDVIQCLQNVKAFLDNNFSGIIDTKEIFESINIKQTRIEEIENQKTSIKVLVLNSTPNGSIVSKDTFSIAMYQIGMTIKGIRSL
ncbi:hypothetical protein BB560_001185 [Smittium megazygosporum]|uniref:EF-hand domain-containing protein n=1 Tax=Smittium megazygosporum TaxID=133381 RepID=A0A2T9ZI77_9FUNG|nr:hypothetical protein BB560_001185 [Smittium megazygosporum]